MFTPSSWRSVVVRVIASALFIGIALGSARAGEPPERDAADKAAAGRVPGPVNLEEEMLAQRALIAELQKQLNAQAAALAELRQRLDASGAAASGLPALVRATESRAARLNLPAAESVARAAVLPSRPTRSAAPEAEAQEPKDELNEKLKGLGRFVFSGDVRLRYEPFFGGGRVDRHRGRFRLRLNVASKFSDELQGGVRISSGSDANPVSRNQSFTGFYAPKAFNIDRAFLKYTPGWAPPLALTGGKFGPTWKRTQLTLDNDLNVEGLSQVLSFDLEKTGPLSNVTLVGYQLPFRESGGGPGSYMTGGQVEAKWNLGRHSLSTSATYSNWFRTDAIRVAQTAGGLGGNRNLHAATGSAFGSRFGILNALAELTLDTGSERWPVKLVFDYATNTRACGQAGIAGVPCNSKDRQAHWAEIMLGKTGKPRDLRFGYALIHIEREAVMGAFNYSDILAPTNVVSHRFQFGYQAYKDFTLGYTLLVGRQLETATSPLEPWLKRMQFDAAYKF